MRKKLSKNTSFREIEHHLRKCNAGIIRHTELLVMYQNMEDKAIKQIKEYIEKKVQLKGFLRIKAHNVFAKKQTLRSKKTTDRLMKL